MCYCFLQLSASGIALEGFCQAFLNGSFLRVEGEGVGCGVAGRVRWVCIPGLAGCIDSRAEDVLAHLIGRV